MLAVDVRSNPRSANRCSAASSIRSRADWSAAPPSPSSPTASELRDASIWCQLVCSNELGLVGGQEQDGVGDVLGLGNVDRQHVHEHGAEAVVTADRGDELVLHVP